jgi:hypothetical protein
MEKLTSTSKGDEADADNFSRWAEYIGPGLRRDGLAHPQVGSEMLPSHGVAGSPGKPVVPLFRFRPSVRLVLTLTSD